MSIRQHSFSFYKNSSCKKLDRFLWDTIEMSPSDDYHQHQIEWKVTESDLSLLILVSDLSQTLYLWFMVGLPMKPWYARASDSRKTAGYRIYFDLTDGISIQHVITSY